MNEIDFLTSSAVLVVTLVLLLLFPFVSSFPILHYEFTVFLGDQRVTIKRKSEHLVEQVSKL